MCGIVVARNYEALTAMMAMLQHRGPDGRHFTLSGPWMVGQTRLSIVDLSNNARQPLETKTGITAFNGEIYNYRDIWDALEEQPEYRNEIHVLDGVMAGCSEFMRVLDGDFAIVRVDRKTGDLVLARDWVGVVPLYYELDGGRVVRVASEKKAFGFVPVGNREVLEVQPGETLRFDLFGKLKKRWRWDPISLHMARIDINQLETLFRRAVIKRYLHSDVPVTVALSGGLDSSLVLWALMEYRPLQGQPVTAVTVVVEDESDEAKNAKMLAEFLKVEHKVVRITEEDIRKHWDKIQYHLEDRTPNPVKWRGMIRNYFVAMATDHDSKVILSGEGADEIFCGYPSHSRAGKGLKLEWKSLSTFRSMPVINLDRVNKGGMAWSKEYRVPFLDRDLALYVMGCRKAGTKFYLRLMAERMGLPAYVIEKPKYGLEEDRLGEIYKRLVAA